MKKILQYIAAFALMFNMICSASSNEINAAQREYEVVFKAGSKGSFDYQVIIPLIKIKQPLHLK